MEVVQEFEHLSPGKKALALGVAAAVGLGLLSAFKNKGTSGSGQTASGSDATGGDSGGLMPPVVEVPTPIMVPVPGSGSTGTGGPDPTWTAPPVISTHPIPVTPVPQPAANTNVSTPAASVPHVSSVPELISSGVSRTDAETIASRDTNIYNLASGAVPAAQVQTVKAAVAASDLHPTAANAANTTANPFGGFGGGNYYTDGPAVAASIAANEQKLHSDSSFVASEITRTNAVIANREAAGVGDSAQTTYLHELQTISSGATHTTSTSSGSGASFTRSATVSTPTPFQQIHAVPTSAVNQLPKQTSAVAYADAYKSDLQKRAASGDSAAATALKNHWY